MLHNIYFTETELDAQLATIVGFLGQVHPELLNNAYQKTCIELRPINRSGEFNISLNRSLNLWRLDDKSIDRLRDYLYKHNGQPYCMYYSVFAFDYAKESYTKSGTKAMKGKITSESALFTNEIVLDFDGVSYVEFEGLSQKLKSLGIEGIWVFTGHGYQFHILLDSPMYDNGDSIYKLVYLLRAKGFMCDSACTDTARLMRLPFTYNCKCFSHEEYDTEYNNPPLCKIVKESDKRTSYDYIIGVLAELPTVSKYDEERYLESMQKRPSDSRESAVPASGDISICLTEYPEFLDLDSLPEPIVKMLKHTPLGYRNNTLGLLIKYFKQYLMFGKEQILSILNIWAECSCEPSYNRVDFERDFERLYGAGGLNYSSELAKQFGYIDFEGQIQLHRDNKVFIPNTVFQSLSVVSGNALRAYLAVKILEHGNEEDEENHVPITIDAIADVTGMSIPTLKRVLPVTKGLGLLFVKQGVKKNGEQNTYHSNKFNNNDAGFKSLSVNDLEVYLSTSKRLQLTDSELKLYLFMLYKFYTKERSLSLDKLGKHVGLTKSVVSRLVATLKKKRYLRVDKVYKDNIVFYNKYTLLK